jgi:hypothetical protein
MKRGIRIVAGMLFIVVCSVGFRYPTSLPASFVNIYLNDTLLLAADENSGIRIYSVADRKNPRTIMTIPLLGPRGMAMKDSIIYANSYSGILALRLHLKEGRYDTASVIRAVPSYMTDYVMGPDVRSPLDCGCTSSNPVKSGGASISTGGSYATFAVIDTFLYYIDSDYSQLVTMTIANPSKPVELSRTDIGWTVETLYPTSRYLFIGGSRGMFVMNRETPSHPLIIGSLQHFKACDPVVVSDTTAFVTLLGGNRCGESRDVLLTVSVADPANPKLLREYPIATPYGLAVSDTLLYIGQGNAGFALFNVKDPANPALVKQWGNLAIKDFIWNGATLYTMGFSSITLVDVADPLNPAALATIQ